MSFRQFFDVGKRWGFHLDDDGGVLDLFQGYAQIWGEKWYEVLLDETALWRISWTGISCLCGFVASLRSDCPPRSI